MHSRVGEQYVGAMVNNRIVSADYQLNNGDIVKIMTSPTGKPSRDWVNFVRSSKAKSRIRSYFKRLDSLQKAEDIQRGRDLLERELKNRLGENFKPVDEVIPYINRVAHDVGYSNADEVLAAIGAGSLGTSGIAQKICVGLNTPVNDSVPQTPEAVTQQAPHGFAQKEADVIVEGASGISVTLAHCCQPVPGDAIVGFSTKVRGIMVHREGCSRLDKVSPDRIIPVSWGNTDKKKYETQFYNMGYLYELQSQLETMKDEQTHGKEVKPEHMEVIRTNLPIVTDFCGMAAYQGDNSYESLNDYMKEAESILSKRSNKISLKADAQVVDFIRQHGKEALVQLKRDNYNLKLEDVVVGADQQRMLDVVGNHIVPRTGIVFLTPLNHIGRAPFYSSEKILGSWHIKTLWFNIAVLLLMSIIVTIFLLTEFPSRYIKRMSMKERT